MGSGGEKVFLFNFLLPLSYSTSGVISCDADDDDVVVADGLRKKSKENYSFKKIKAYEHNNY